MPSETPFDATVAALRACRICRDAPLYGAPLPQEPRPIVQGAASARLCVASQAPGNRADRSGVPFMDPSGTRLRDWLGLDEAAFYDASRLAIVPMGACFPGYDAKGGDKPPRRECAERWRAELFAGLPDLELILVIGQYAQTWHLGRSKAGLTDTVRRWRGSSRRRGTRASCRCPIPPGATAAGSRPTPGSRPTCCLFSRPRWRAPWPPVGSTTR